jgi:hypothetical protein
MYYIYNNPMKAPPERIGSFYLGSEHDLNSGESTGDNINYDARDLTTHAVCVGMTGSGKTGLCICLLEEAAIDKVPAIIIDPKGDITNHLLHFPDLLPDDFSEWINIDDARRKGLSREEYSIQIAETWRKGLEKWGIGKSRIELLAKSVDYTIYTPGSNSGIPVNILSSLEAPKMQDTETLIDLITGTVSALLELTNLNADPIRSREGILLSNILQYHWTKNHNLSLEKLIQEIQTPPFNRLGVFDLETFYPIQNRMELAITLNSLLASPSFIEWLTGDPLDISKFLYDGDGKPRHSVFCLSHLSEEERMFFVTLLLERVSTWIRQQPGTTSLRAILYFDEVFGYMPPVANPSSKTPLLRLLKQARAYGLGVVITTQNPVDIDYKGLTNTGTWFIGKLQTERDKKRVLDGLQSAEQVLDQSIEKDYSDIIGSLDSRVFLLHNVHEEGPKVFHTRWAMNYLRGPLTGIQIRKLMENKKEKISIKPRKIPKIDSELSKTPPTIDPTIEQLFIERNFDSGDIITVQKLEKGYDNEKLAFVPTLLLNFSVRFVNKKRGIDKIEQTWALAPEPNNFGEIEWSRMGNIDPGKIHDTQITLKELEGVRKKLSNYLYRNSSYSIWFHKALGFGQDQNESKKDFLIKVAQVARERRDLEIDKLEKKYEKKLDKLNSKISKLTSSLSADKAEYDARKREEILGIGETIIGVFMGRRTSGATTASRRRRMTTRAKYDIEDTKKQIEELKKEFNELEEELREQVDEITEQWSSAEDNIQEYQITPRRADIEVDEIRIAWVPI